MRVAPRGHLSGLGTMGAKVVSQAVLVLALLHVALAPSTAAAAALAEVGGEGIKHVAQVEKALLQELPGFLTCLLQGKAVKPAVKLFQNAFQELL